MFYLCIGLTARPSTSSGYTRPANLRLPLAHTPIDRAAPIPRTTPGRSANTVVVVHAPQGEVVVPVRIRDAIAVQVGGQAGRQTLHLRGKYLPALIVGIPGVSPSTGRWYINGAIARRPRRDACVAISFPCTCAVVPSPSISPRNIRTIATAAIAVPDVLVVR